MQDISYVCEKGGREYNQDSVMFSQKGGKYCIVVADGLGSYTGSEIASHIACKFVIDWFNSHYDDEDLFAKSCISDVLAKAHYKIWEEKNNNYDIYSSCTTIAVVISDNKTTVMAHIGDTRIYEIKDGKIDFVSKDHSLAQLAVDRGEIFKKDIPNHPDQNKLTKVLGSDYFIGPDVKTDFFELAIGDGFLVCTDGMWEYLFDNEIENEFVINSSSNEKLQTFVGFHDTRADAYCDNFTAVVAIRRH